MDYAPDPKSPIHAEASPYISLHVLYGLISEARKAGITHISVTDLETACDKYKKVMRK